MNYLKMAKRAVYESIYHQHPAILNVRETYGQASLNVSVSVKFEDEIVKSFSMTSDKVLITSVKISLTANVVDRLENPPQPQCLCLKDTIDPEIVVDENGRVDQGKMAPFKEVLIIRVSEEIAKRFKHEYAYKARLPDINSTFYEQIGFRYFPENKNCALSDSAKATSAEYKDTLDSSALK